jgi:hypothetical protein
MDSLLGPADVLAIRRDPLERGPFGGTLVVVTTPGQADAALRFVAACEAVVLLERSGEPTDTLDDAVWQTQTSIWANPTNPTCTDGTQYCYDLTAKLFANGVDGTGQVVALHDSGLENDDCHFRYGPNPGDATLPLPRDYQPPFVAPPQELARSKDNKVVAYYVIDDPTVTVLGFPFPCAPAPFEMIEPGPGDPLPPYDREFHGTRVAGCAAGDDYFVLASRLDEPLDDPIDDEQEDDRSQAYARRIDHHQLADGMAPGARIIVQDWPRCLVDMFTGEVLAQAYHTPPGARAHNGSWSQPSFAEVSYTDETADIDFQAWRFRDLVITRSAGNTGPPFDGDPRQLGRQANAKNVLTVGASWSGTGTPELTVAPSSAHGPSTGERLKPELVAPGQAPITPWPTSRSPETGIGNGGDECEEVRASGGTSFSAPIVAGSSLDVRQYVVDGYYPGGSSRSSVGFNPTNALTRAVLVNATRSLVYGVNTADDSSTDAMPLAVPTPRPTHGQGWGFPVLDDTLFFAGDPTNPPTVPPGEIPGLERSALLVFTDTPSGLHDPNDTTRINDRRGAILDSFRDTISQGEIHTHTFCVLDPTTEELHVTLAWTDPPGDPDVGNLAIPLVNDLDLEVVDPEGRVWRPNPGHGTSDPQRLWAGGHSILGDQPCPITPGCAEPCPSGLERDHAQGTPPACDLGGRDRRNSIENVFVAPPDVRQGTYTLRVIGYDVPGRKFHLTTAYPNFVNGTAPCWQT